MGDVLDDELAEELRLGLAPLETPKARASSRSASRSLVLTSPWGRSDPFSRDFFIRAWRAVIKEWTKSA